MNQIPTAEPHTEGRTLGTDWSIANVAKLLRWNAGTGAWDSSCATSGSRAAVNRYYIRKGSAKHLPTNVSLIFMRLGLPFTHNRRWTKSLISQRKPEAHELKCGVALPDQLMTGRWVVVASEISADLRDHAYRFTQQHGWLQAFFFA
jgi:hypothetical protein